jgi:dTDP-4-dehydrorhamnose reductase
MLGHQLCRILSGRFDVWGTFREARETYTRHDILPTERMIDRVFAEDCSSVHRALDIAKPDAVVNALGIVKQRDEAKAAIPSITVNALFPHQLAEICDQHQVRMIQISTDCVFSGMRGNYSEVDTPDPVDLYGRTKLLGEVQRPGCLTLRTSIIGWQLNTFSGLLSWFAGQRGRRIKGYRKAIYSGFSTTILANLIGDIIETRPDLHGLYHVASASISKYDLLVRLRDILGWKDIAIDPDEQFFCDRSLNGTRFSTTTGWLAPNWDSMLLGLAEEWPGYAAYYQTAK